MQLGVGEVVAVVGEFAARLDVNRGALDALNVFPIADNDTGTNMVNTLTTIVAALAGATSLDAVARQVETAALDGRGNSGLIVGQFLAGFCAAFDGDRIDLEQGLAKGARWARRAVAAPVEGTMLTVADVAASATQNGHSVDQLVSIVADAVQATPSQLAVLAERGVVDSGAAGLLLFFEALRSSANGEVDVSATDLIVCNVGNEPTGIDAADRHDGSYEIQFRVPASLVEIDALRSLLIGLGTDVVIAASTKELAVHVHVGDPHVATAAISEALENTPGAKAISYDIEPIITSGRQP